ncbi:MAG: HAD family hydrolase [Gemmataceae bacterium]
MSPVPGTTTQAVLFDLDGTLIDSYPAIAASVNHVRSLHGLAALSVSEVTRHVGRGPYHLLHSTVGPTDLDASVAAYRQHHPGVLRELTVLLPGAREMLQQLHTRGYKLGICSNKPVEFTRALVDHLGIGTWLTVVLGPEDVGRHKPAPDMLLAAMERLHVSPSETLYIGDMTVDIESARAADVAVWVVPTGSDTVEALDAAHPDRRLASLHELPGLLGA